MFNLTNFSYFLAYISLASVLLIILAPTPLHMVFFGLLFYVALGWLFIVSGYDSIGIVLIILYAGALMVMFLFVVMVFDLAGTLVTKQADVLRWWRLFAVLGLLALFLFSGRWGIRILDLPHIANFCFCDCSAVSFLFSSSRVAVSLPSVLASLALVFYQVYPISLVFCGLVLVVGLVGAFGLTSGSHFLSFQRQRFVVAPRIFRARHRVIVLC